MFQHLIFVFQPQCASRQKKTGVCMPDAKAVEKIGKKIG